MCQSKSQDLGQPELRLIEPLREVASKVNNKNL